MIYPFTNELSSNYISNQAMAMILVFLLDVIKNEQTHIYSLAKRLHFTVIIF